MVDTNTRPSFRDVLADVLVGALAMAGVLAFLSLLSGCAGGVERIDGASLRGVYTFHGFDFPATIRVSRTNGSLDLVVWPDETESLPRSCFVRVGEEAGTTDQEGNTIFRAAGSRAIDDYCVSRSFRSSYECSTNGYVIVTAGGRINAEYEVNCVAAEDSIGWNVRIRSQ